MSSYRVGLTGGLAAGKSTVAGWLAEAGLQVVDADRLVAELYRPGRPGAEAVARLFGPEFLDRSGGVAREMLAARVFTDSEARRRLEEVIHPLVRERFERSVAGRSGVVILEATLLVEAGLHRECDLVVTVEADPEVRIRRAVERGLDEAEARRRLAAQAGSELRIAAADLVLRNDGTLEQLRRRVDSLIDRLQETSDDG